MQRKKGEVKKKKCELLFPVFGESLPTYAHPTMEIPKTFFFFFLFSIQHPKRQRGTRTGIVFCIIVLISISFHYFVCFFFYRRRSRIIALNCPAAIATFIRRILLSLNAILCIFDRVSRPYKCAIVHSSTAAAAHTHTLHIYKYINQRLICPNEIVVRNFPQHYPLFKRNGKSKCTRIKYYGWKKEN